MTQHKPSRTEILAIIETYEGMIEQYNNAEAPAHLWDAVAKWYRALKEAP